MVAEKDLPATRGMLRLVRDELKGDIRNLDAKIGGLDAKFNQLDARLTHQDAKFNQLESKLDTKLDRMQLLLEEQRADNKIVLEALTGLATRQDNLETRMDALESTVRSLAKAKPISQN